VPVRLVLGIAILTAQLASVGYAHFGPAPQGQSWLHKTLDGCSGEPAGCRRYFAWAPNDYVVEYRLAVVVGGRKLSFADALRRYRLPRSSETIKSYWEDPPQRLVDTVERYERGHDRPGADRVLLTYTVNGGRKHAWRWPHP
jgi:hypothetical protein